MQILKYPLGEFQANCYLLIKDNKCLIIDPGDNADFLLEEISRKNLDLIGMFATHGHFDHVMGAGSLQVGIDIPLLINHKDLFLVKRLRETAKHFLGYEPIVIPPKTRDLILDDFKIQNFKFQIIPTPGHTPGAVCFYFSQEKVVFTGDTLFKDAIGSYEHSYSSKKDLFTSLKYLIEILPDETTVYSGHGDETTIDDEKTHFKFDDII